MENKRKRLKLSAVDKLSSTHPDWHVHDYGKKEAKYNRKMGHVTILTDDFEQTLEEVENTKIWPSACANAI